jgi:predicted O-methyltransferase YrrM
MEHFHYTIKGWFTFPELYKTAAQYVPDGGHVVEIGAFLGKSTSFMAVELFNSGKRVKFDVIDTWQGSPEHVETFKDLGYEPEDKNILYKEFLRNMAPVKHIINPLRTDSVTGGKLYPDESLDFVFIDAGHEYEDVKNDLLTWCPKVKKGGIIAGHDYFFPSDPEHGHKYPGVKKAVDEFFTNIKADVLISSAEYCWLYQVR